MIPMLVSLIVFVGLSVRILRRRAIDSWSELACWIAAGVIASLLAIGTIRA